MEEEIRQIDTKDNTLWKNLNKFEKNKTHISKLVVNGETLKKEKVIAEALASNYEETFKGNRTMGYLEIEEEVLNEIEGLQNIIIERGDEIAYTNKEELQLIIKRFKNNKAPGEDGIQGITLKNLPTNIIEVIVDIINSSIRKRYFPNN